MTLDPSIEVPPTQQIRQNDLLVDIRFDDERSLCGEIPGALPLPLPCLYHLYGLPEAVREEHREFMASQVPPLERALARRVRIPLICAHGNRSLEAARILRELGADAWSVAGGHELWEALQRAA